MAVSPLTADTNPESFAEGVAKRQAILRGSMKLGQSMQRLGSGMVAYGSTPQPRGRQSVVSRRGSGGERQWKGAYSHEGIKYDRPAPRGNKWAGYETKHDSKAGTKAPSSRTAQRSSSLVNIGTVIYVAGRWVPVLGIGYAYYDILGDGREPHKQFADDAKWQIDMTQDAIQTVALGAKATYSVAKIATKLALPFSF